MTDVPYYQRPELNSVWQVETPKGTFWKWQVRDFICSLQTGEQYVIIEYVDPPTDGMVEYGNMHIMFLVDFLEVYTPVD